MIETAGSISLFIHQSDNGSGISVGGREGAVAQRAYLTVKTDYRESATYVNAQFLEVPNYSQKNSGSADMDRARELCSPGFNYYRRGLPKCNPTAGAS